LSVSADEKSLTLFGVDFSSAPGPRKHIVVAQGQRVGSVVRLQGLQFLPSLAGFEAWLQTPGPWLAGFDLPFGLPRAFVDSLALGRTAAEVCAQVHQRCATRMDFRRLVDAWGNGQPAGQRLLHRATDLLLAGVSSTSPLQTRYVPVGFMYFEGFARILASGADVPGLHPGDAQRRALEAYPGALAHALIGKRSYKNDASHERLLARKDMLEALEQGRSSLGLRLKLTPAQAGVLVADASGDALDAVLSLLQAAWALGQDRLGLPPQMDVVEGWIVGAVAPASALAAGAEIAALPPARKRPARP
jgi:hypothetical protein